MYQNKSVPADICHLELRFYNDPGTPLGDKTIEVAQKVATDTAEELKKSAAALDREIPGN